MDKAGIKHDPRNARKGPSSTTGYSAVPTAGRRRVGFVATADRTDEASRCGSVVGVLAGSAQFSMARFLPAALWASIVRATSTLTIRPVPRWRPQVANLPLNSCMARNTEDLQVIRIVRRANPKRDAMVNVKIAAMQLMVAVVRHTAFLALRTASVDGVNTNVRPLVPVSTVVSTAPVWVSATSDLRSMLGACAIVGAIVRRFPYVTRYLLERHATAVTGKRHALSVGHRPALVGAKPLTALVAIHSGCWQRERLTARFTYPRDRIRFQSAISSVLPSITGVF